MPTKSKKASKEEGSPLEFKRWRSEIRELKAKGRKDDVELLVASFEPNQSQDVKIVQNNGRVEVIVRTKLIGEHFSPPAVKSVRLDTKALRHAELRTENLESFRPEHLAFRALPMNLEKDSAMVRRWERSPEREDEFGVPGTVFAPDTRREFRDRVFPFCTCGRVQTAGGWGSGVLVGPRHMMTASHTIKWGADNSVGYLKFVPLQYGDEQPFGIAYATKIYQWRKVTSIPMTSIDVAFYYAVCVLDRRLGDILGWMGASVYSSNWNGGAYWAHIGYPFDKGGGVRPVFDGNGVIDCAYSETISGHAGLRTMHRNDYKVGQSGGPAYGMFGQEARVVGIYSATDWGITDGPNANGGGNALVELINYARTQDP